MDISLWETDKFMWIEFSSNTVKDHQFYELSTLQNISHNYSYCTSKSYIDSGKQPLNRVKGRMDIKSRSLYLLSFEFESLNYSDF